MDGLSGELVAKLLPGPYAPFYGYRPFFLTYFEKIDLLRGVSKSNKILHIDQVSKDYFFTKAIQIYEHIFIS